MASWTWRSRTVTAPTRRAAWRYTELVCNAGTVSILLGNGDGSFQPHLDYATGKNPSALAAADFNADGKLDLAIVNVEDGSVSVLLGQGDGSFQSQVVYKVPGAARTGGWRLQ